jgi:hypothetical protein
MNDPVNNVMVGTIRDLLTLWIHYRLLMVSVRAAKLAASTSGSDVGFG